MDVLGAEEVSGTTTKLGASSQTHSNQQQTFTHTAVECLFETLAAKALTYDRWISRSQLSLLNHAISSTNPLNLVRIPSATNKQGLIDTPLRLYAPALQKTVNLYFIYIRGVKQCFEHFCQGTYSRVGPVTFRISFFPLFLIGIRGRVTSSVYSHSRL